MNSGLMVVLRQTKRIRKFEDRQPNSRAFSFIISEKASLLPTILKANCTLIAESNRDAYIASLTELPHLRPRQPNVTFRDIIKHLFGYGDCIFGVEILDGQEYGQIFVVLAGCGDVNIFPEQKGVGLGIVQHIRLPLIECVGRVSNRMVGENTSVARR